MVRIGTAGWTIPAHVRGRFPPDGAGLARYAARFGCVEINSSFYRPHRSSTYERWASLVPAEFRFALKVPREITHVRMLVDPADALERFLHETAALGDRRGVLLVQLPPSLAFDRGAAGAFFESFRARYDGHMACEPRHPSWFGAEAETLLRAHRVARVAADPAVVPEAADPGGWEGFAYHRLHGSPQMYASSYDDARLQLLAARLEDAPDAWCIFDNTRSGAAAADALRLTELLGGAQKGRASQR